MIIGIDIDGTLTDFSGFIFANAVAFMKQFGLTVHNHCGYDVDEIFDIEQTFLDRGCSSAEAKNESNKISEKFWKQFYVKYCFSSLRKDSRCVLRRFKKDGHEIVIITSRKRTCEKTIVGRIVRIATLLQLWLNGISYQRVIFLPNDSEKIDVINACKFDLLVDDKPEIVEQIEKQTYVIAIRTNYNASLLSTQIHQADTWIAIYNLARQNKEYNRPNMMRNVKKQDSFYNTIRVLLGPLIRLIWKPIIINKELTNELDGATVFAPNHRRTVDPLIISALIDAPIHWAALKRFFDGHDSIFNNSKNRLLCAITAVFFHKLGFVPIDRATCNLDGARKMRNLLAMGCNIGIFPEGTTNKSPEHQDVLEPRLGAAFLAKVENAWIQPISITWVPAEIRTRSRVIINFRQPYKAENSKLAEQEKWKETICNGISKNKKIINYLANNGKIDYRALEQMERDE